MGKWHQGKKTIEGRSPRKLLLQGRKWEVVEGKAAEIKGEGL